MANVYAVKSGNWSDVTVWNTGALPTSADDVYSNNFTVTVDTSPTVLSIRNTAASPIVAGGGFTLTSGTSLTATATAGVISTSGAIIGLSLGATGTATLNANISINSNTLGCMAFPNTGTTLNINGNVSYTGQGYCWIFNSSGASFGTINLVGNITAPSGGTGGGDVFYVSCLSGTINITATTITGGSNSNQCLRVMGPGGTFNITGQAIGGSSQPAFSLNGTGGIITLTGAATAGAANAFINSGSGTITHIGTAQASATAAAIGQGSVSQVTILTGPLLSSDASFTGASSSGVNPCIALRWFPKNTALSTFKYTMRAQNVVGIRSERNFFNASAYSTTYPSTTNVRRNVTYGPAGIYTGTMDIPNPQTVGFGVPVGTTTGTAVLALDDIWNSSIVGIASTGSIGERLKNCATVESVAQTISNALR